MAKKSKSTAPHKTKKVIITTAEVDEKIIPLVTWLNTFPLTKTLWSCQGTDTEYDLLRTGAPDGAYVNILTCMRDIKAIGRVLQNRVIWELQPGFDVYLRATIRFKTKHDFNTIIDAIKSNFTSYHMEDYN